MKIKKSSDAVLIKAMSYLASDIESGDGIANAACLEASHRLQELVSGIRAVLEKNAHLADGEDCTLIDLKMLLEGQKADKGLNFGDAIQALKQGRRVTRSGWNGKGMYLWMLPAALVPVGWIKEPHLKEIAETRGGLVECLASIRMRTATGDVLTGWLASQSDMFAEDWEIIREVEG